MAQPMNNPTIPLRGALCRPPSQQKQHTTLRFGQTGTFLPLKDKRYLMFQPDGNALKFMIYSHDAYIPGQ